METLNITELITETINNIFSSFFSSIDNTIYSIIDELAFINEDIMNDSYLEKILGTDSSNGFLLIANSLLVGFILYYAISLLLSHLTFTNQEHPLKFIFRIILLGLFINSAYFICDRIIFLNSTISLAIREVGENLFNKDICFSGLIKDLNEFIYSEANGFDVFSFNGIIKGFISFGLFNLIFSYSLRYIMIKVFILISPFAILCLSNEKSFWFFKSWLRNLLSLLFMQILISIILVITFSVNLSSTNLFSNLMYVGSIYALIQANHFIKEFMGGISTNVQTGLTNIKSMFSM